jgi:hypothetical protein
VAKHSPADPDPRHPRVADAVVGWEAAPEAKAIASVMHTFRASHVSRLRRRDARAEREAGAGPTIEIVAKH